METPRDYRIVSRFFTSEGWQNRELTLSATTLENAWRRASEVATRLDQEFGNDHFWTVDVKKPDADSSYVQLFHGRLS